MRFFFFTIACLSATAASAMQFPAQPLWALVNDADVIVIADVSLKWSEPFPETVEEFWVDRDHVSLSVRETLKGSAPAALVVDYSAGLICPAPPRYEVGRRVLAFLKQGTDGRFSTVGLSYGTRYPAESELDAFRTRIREAVALQSDPPVSDVDMIDWLIRTAAQPATRWHGIEPFGNYMRAGFGYSGKRDVQLADMLRPEQLEQLRRVFLLAPPDDDTLPMFLAALRNDRSREIDAAAIAAVGRMNASTTRSGSRPIAFALLLDRLGEKDLRTRYENASRSGLIDVDTAWTELRQRRPELFPRP